MMRILLALAFVLSVSVVAAQANGTKKGPRPYMAPQGTSCMKDLVASCRATHRTRTGTKICVWRNKYRCR